MADDNEMNGDDGWWDCSLCTYRNSAEKFKCEICDLRRGTSTRKPRCSTDTIVAQVVKQQEQIRQQTKAKPSPKSKTARENPVTSARDNSSTPARDQPSTPEPTTSSPHNNNHLSPASTITNASSASSNSSTSTASTPTTPTTPTSSKPRQSQDNSVKIRPIEVIGNLIKYLPPTSTGRTGLIIDKKRFTQHSVTVDDVTITFTEFATRQNKYVRKKKKKSGKAAGSQSSSRIKLERIDSPTI